VAETDTPQAQDAPGEYLLYDEYMTRVYVADAKPEERSAFRLLLLDLEMEVVGEAADWETTLAQAPVSRTDMLLIDWDLLPRTSPSIALDKLRSACPAPLLFILISHSDVHQQANLSSGADMLISTGETPERVAESLCAAARAVTFLNENGRIN